MHERLQPPLSFVHGAHLRHTNVSVFRKNRQRAGQLSQRREKG